MPNGYGTYLSAGLVLAATLAHAFGWIDEKAYEAAIGIAGAGGLSFLRRAVSTTTADLATGQAVIAKEVGVPAASIEAHIGPQPPPKVG